MYKSLLITVAALSLGACSGRTVMVEPDPAPGALVPAAHRITDEAIASDRRYIETLRGRLAALNNAGMPVNDYHFCKAQAWVDEAAAEYSDNDRTGVIEAALEQALTLIEGMEQGHDLQRSTPVIETASLMREDLWRFVYEAEQQPHAHCASCELARLEVQLVMIGHEDNELGWRHSVPAIAVAERLRQEAQFAMEACARPAVAVAAPAVVAPAPAAVPVETPAVFPGTKVPGYVHFALDRAQLSDESLAVVHEIASVMQVDEDLRVRLVGHTDVRGMSEYNAALAWRRVRAVRDALIAEGVNPGRLDMQAAGPYNPRAFGDTFESHARNRRVELVVTYPTGGVEAFPQESDLQPEGLNAQGESFGRVDADE